MCATIRVVVKGTHTENRKGSMTTLQLLAALAKAERNGWWIPAGWHRLTDEQRAAWAADVLDNDGKLTNGG
jgi:hypothetical protein